MRLGLTSSRLSYAEQQRRLMEAVLTICENTGRAQTRQRVWTMRPRNKPWTKEEIERLKKFAAGGATAARAASALNRKIISIQTQAAKLGIRFPTVRELHKKPGTAPPALRS